MDIPQVLNNIGAAVRFVGEVRDRPTPLPHAEAADPAKLLVIILKPHSEAFHPPPSNLCALSPRRSARPKFVVEELEGEGGYLARSRILVKVQGLPWRGLRSCAGQERRLIRQSRASRRARRREQSPRRFRACLPREKVVLGIDIHRVSAQEVRLQKECVAKRW